ncbi:FecR family protein [Terrihabitans sp. B22-R8]|uniref:FecR family protein n=1 Tax=Terrihabitans sp. B22-R8 TaxID=3425128 RepID=UPI00403CED69
MPRPSDSVPETEKRHEIDRRIELDARDWIVRLTSGDVSQADLDRFKAWRDASSAHRHAFERERTFWQELRVLDGAGPEAPVRVARMRSGPAVMGRRAFVLGGSALAAAAAGAAVLPSLDLWRRADYITAAGEQSEVRLPDGSTAWLNTDSAIALDFQPGLRLVELLRGEVEFQVRPESSSIFRVSAFGGNSDALGTTFSVQATDSLTVVTVSEGEVRVSGQVAPADLPEAVADSVLASAGEQAVYGRGEKPSSAHRVDIDVARAWRMGKIVFEARSFASAIGELGRYLPEHIVMAPGVDVGVPVSAEFRTSEVLAAVEALARTQGRTARRIPGVVVLIA